MQPENVLPFLEKFTIKLYSEPVKLSSYRHTIFIQDLINSIFFIYTYDRSGLPAKILYPFLSCPSDPQF